MNTHPAHLVADMFRGLTPVFNNQDSTMITPLLATGMQAFSFLTMMRSMVDAACSWMKAGLPLRCLKIVLFSENTDRIPEGIKDLVSLFEKLKSKWEKKGVSLKASSVQYDIYLSYSTMDEERVNIIKMILAKRYKSIKVFSDKQEMWAEQAWQEAMYEKMTACKRIVALLTPAYLESPNCLEQFNIALCCTRLQSLILLTPLYLENVSSMPVYMQLVQYIDCRANPPEWPIEKLLSQACESITQSITQTSSETQPHLPSTLVTYDVFISYSHQTPDEAEQFRDYLQTHSPSTKVFFDRSGLVAGMSWQKTLYGVLDNVRCVLAFVTTPYLQSAVCQEEYNISLARAMSQDDNMLFLPVCVDDDLEQISLPFCGVKMLDGRGKKYTALIPDLSRDLVTWLERGDQSPLFPSPEKILDVSVVTEEFRKMELKRHFDMTKKTLQKKSFNLDGIAQGTEQDGIGCDVHFCYSQDDTRLAAVLSQMISDIIPDVTVSFGAGTPQERFQKLDTAGRIVVFISPALLLSPQLVDELHMALCRHRVATKGPLIYTVQTGPLDPKPVFLHLLHYNLSLHDKMWQELAAKTQVLDSHRTVVIRGGLRGSYSCSHMETVGLRKACLDLAEEILHQRSGKKTSSVSQNGNLLNVIQVDLQQSLQPDRETCPLTEALWNCTPELKQTTDVEDRKSKDESDRKKSDVNSERPCVESSTKHGPENEQLSNCRPIKH
ncbi:uncharacterized protein LOC135468030 isoform X2 [Liolophura sinensis]